MAENIEEEEQEQALQALLRCTMCGREVLSNGSYRSGEAFCNHKYAPIPTATPQSPTQAKEPSPALSATSNRSKASQTNKTVLPTLEESVELEAVRHNFDQTEDYIKRFETDVQTLNNTLEECQNEIDKEFGMLHDLLIQRKDELLEELQTRYDEKNNKLKKQIEDLRTHADNSEDCKDKCMGLISSMTSRDEVKERTPKIISSCKELVSATPEINEVPIDLKFSFRTQRDVCDKLNRYGRLQFKTLDTGKRIEYTLPKFKLAPMGDNNNNNNKNGKNNVRNNVNIGRRAQNGYNGHNGHNVEKKDENIHNSESNDEEHEDMELVGDKPKVIVLPSLKRASIRYRAAQNELKYEPTIREPDFEDGKLGIDEKEYESYKKTNIFLHMQWIGNHSKDDIPKENWDTAVKRYENYELLPEPGKNGRVSLDIPSNVFERNTCIHVRVRFVYLDSGDVIQDGKVEDEDIVEKTEWFPEKSSLFKGSENHVCTFQQAPELGGGEMIIPPSGVEGDNNEAGGLNMAQEQPGQAGPPLHALAGAAAQVPMGNLPNKIKLKVDLILQNQKPISKQFPFKEYSFDKLLEKTRSRAKLPDGNFEFCLSADPSKTITNTQEFIGYCVNNEPDTKGYNAHIQATQV